MPNVTLLPLASLATPLLTDGGDRFAENGESRGDGPLADPSGPTSASVASSRFICGVPMKLATNRLVGLEKSSCGEAICSILPCLHDRDAVRHGQRFDLVVSDDDRRLVEFGEDFLDLRSHRLTQLDVETAQGFVEQKARGIAHDGAADRDALLFTLAELMRTALQDRL